MINERFNINFNSGGYTCRCKCYAVNDVTSIGDILSLH